MKRDSFWWWVVIAGSVATSVMSRWDVLEPLLPMGHREKIHAVIELIALLAGIAGAKMATSPLPISDKGRQKYTGDTVRIDPNGPPEVRQAQ